MRGAKPLFLGPPETPAAKKCPETGLFAHIPLYIRRAFPYDQFDLIAFGARKSSVSVASGSEKPIPKVNLGGSETFYG
jgi:hypothetical protein